MNISTIADLSPFVSAQLQTEKKKKRIEKCGSVSEVNSSNVAKFDMAQMYPFANVKFVLPFAVKKILTFQFPLAMFTS